ncbi:MAG: NAD(P)-dependent alcohol dehydrogenase [Micropruina sp.]|nr:NAD(P)-dependent alcohol dehydrogenase [Micropruina sp.]
MRAAVIDRYGAPEVVRIAEVATPEPKPGEVLVRVMAAAVTSADARIRAARFPRGFGVPARLFFGVRRPRRPILGGCFSGVVEAVGSQVSGLAVGDSVSGMTGMRLGTHAEYVNVPATSVVAKPAQVSHEEAAGVLFGGATALYCLRDKAALAPGRSVLINGASGAIGTNAVQLAKHLGADVTAVTSAANRELVLGLGADRVIDHTHTDVTATGERFDVVLDAVGNLTIASSRPLLTERGLLLLAVANVADTIRARGNVVAVSAPERGEDFAYLLRLVEQGHLRVINALACDLADIVEAHRRVDSGRKVGNVVVRP